MMKVSDRKGEFIYPGGLNLHVFQSFIAVLFMGHHINPIRLRYTFFMNTGLSLQIRSETSTTIDPTFKIPVFYSVQIFKNIYMYPIYSTRIFIKQQPNHNFQVNLAKFNLPRQVINDSCRERHIE